LWWTMVADAKDLGDVQPLAYTSQYTLYTVPYDGVSKSLVPLEVEGRPFEIIYDQEYVPLDGSGRGGGGCGCAYGWALMLGSI
jgi:hypothetical protein